MHRPLIVVASLAALSLTACSLAGSRAKTGTCPSGEVCSDETPNGLFFKGPELGDTVLPLGGSARPTARGGTQTITVVTGSSLSSPEFEDDFDAEIATTNDIMAIAGVSPPNVVVSGNHPGKAFLRLLEPGTDLLLERVQLSVDAIATADAFPAELGLVAQEPYAVLAGSEVVLVARLRSSAGSRLVDESMTFSGGTIFGRAAWDSVLVHAAPGDFDIEMKAGDGTPFTSTVPVVTSIDAIELAPIIGDELDVQVLSSTTACFVARSSGAAVAGAAWSFGASDGAATEESALLDLPGCIDIAGVTPGTATLTVTASGKTVAFPVSVKPKTMLARPAGAPYADASATALHAGERALLAHSE